MVLKWRYKQFETDGKWVIFGYARASTEEQNLDMQIDTCSNKKALTHVEGSVFLHIPLLSGKMYS